MRFLFSKKADKQIWIIVTLILAVIVLVVLAWMLLRNWGAGSTFLGGLTDTATNSIEELPIGLQ